MGRRCNPATRLLGVLAPLLLCVATALAAGEEPPGKASACQGVCAYGSGSTVACSSGRRGEVRVRVRAVRAVVVRAAPRCRSDCMHPLTTNLTIPYTHTHTHTRTHTHTYRLPEPWVHLHEGVPARLRRVSVVAAAASALLSACVDACVRDGRQQLCAKSAAHTTICACLSTQTTQTTQQQGP